METNDVLIVIYTFTVVLLVLGIFFVLFYLLFQKKQKANQLKLAELNEQLLTTQIEIQEQILENISQEIHDNIGQVLSLAKLNLATIQIADDDFTKTKIVDTKELVSKALVDLRDLARSMHGEKITEIGLQKAVENELKLLKNTGKFQTHFTAEGEPFDLAPQTQIILFRIIQEALHNEIKHSKAANIYINFKYNPADFIVLVHDDGIGFDTEKLNAANSGIGLKSMKKRAAMIGGTFSITSVAQKGTTINIKLLKDFHNIASV